VRPAAPLVLVTVVAFEAIEEVSAMTVVFELGDITSLVVTRLVEFEADGSVESSVDDDIVESDAGEITEAAVVELDIVLFNCA